MSENFYSIPRRHLQQEYNLNNNFPPIFRFYALSSGRNTKAEKTLHCRNGDLMDCRVQQTQKSLNAEKLS
jgi:hypothetical protein